MLEPSSRPNLRTLLGCLLLSCASATSAGAATLSGVVINGQTGQPVRGATIEIDGAEVQGTSDLNGLVLLDLEPGTYAATARKDGFEPAKVTDIVVQGAGGDFAIVLEPTSTDGTTGSVITEEITVQAQAETASEAALLAERKNAAQISDSIGSEEMSKTTGGDAAGVLKRVTGLSLQDDKFVYVRGLGDRYSSTALNGSKIPSTEFEKKVVPLDLFPKDLIQKITVSKSYTVDKPGDFVAGLVELSTVEFPVRQTGSVGLSVGYNSVTTGDTWLEYPEGLDFFGDGGQASNLPEESLNRFSPFTGEGFTPEELEEIGESIGGRWTPDVGSGAPVDTGFDFSYGNSQDRWGYSLSATYESGVSTVVDDQQNFYNISQGQPVLATNYSIDRSEETVRQALTGNLAYKASENSQVRFSAIYTDLSNALAWDQEGFFSDLSQDFRDNVLRYREQEITNFQLSGDHFFSGLGDGGLLEWKGSVSEAETAENRREVIYTAPEGTTDFVLTDNASSGFLFFNDLTDEVQDFGVDWSSLFSGEDVFGSVKVGLAYSTNDRVFDGRRVRFFHRNTFGIDLSQTPEELFSEEFIRPRGFEIQEITRATDTYEGEHEIPAAYVQGDVSFGRYRLIGGVRVEDSRQDVVTFDRTNPDNPPITTTIDEQDVLPALSLVVGIGNSTNLRFSASQTVNRPEYRELAPFIFQNVAGGFSQQGNPDLLPATITSFDARWEWFPSAREVIAASVFYKDFEDPIEQVLFAGSTQIETFENAAAAENVGAEVEVRKNLGGLSEALEPLTAIFNFAYIDSEIDLPEGTPLTNEARPLVGQPDSVGNFILEWDGGGSAVFRLLYNYTGEKVFTAGGFGLEDVLEDPRGVLDFVWVQGLDRWVSGLKFKVSASNLTDEENLWTQDGQVYRVYEPGRSIGLSFSFDPF